MVSSHEIENAGPQLSEQLRSAILTARKNIELFHRAQELPEVKVETMPGVLCWTKSVPIEKIGLYIPGGSAPLFSTVLMLGVPAQIAGCSTVVLCTPPRPDGSVHPAILFTADLVGIDNIYKVGGAQAIAAMAYGTETVPRVYKLFGPGNQYVTAAKLQSQREGMAIDLPAGPSEVMVMADKSANPAYVAADLLSQAEHGEDSQVLLVSTDGEIVERVLKELVNQAGTLPRKDIALEAFKISKAVYFKDPSDAVEFANNYAPEHLIIQMREPEDIASEIKNAGSVFLGPYSPESIGDYASGTNHTLPTNGSARAYGGVSLNSFVKKITFQKITREGLKSIGPVVEKLALAESLAGHQRSVRIRLEDQGL
jgi:histidinol dehydrogenase